MKICNSTTWTTRTALKTRVRLRSSGRVSKSFSAIVICHASLVANPVTSHEWGKDRIVITVVIPLIYVNILIITKNFLSLRRVWRYQRGNQNLYIEEEQTTQWPKEKEIFVINCKWMQAIGTFVLICKLLRSI